jgi:transcriptional regulator with XRE-family HTH domain
MQGLQLASANWRHHWQCCRRSRRYLVTSNMEQAVSSQTAILNYPSQQYISSLERGRRNPTIITLYELSVALGVNHVDLIRPPKGRHQRR